MQSRAARPGDIEIKMILSRQWCLSLRRSAVILVSGLLMTQSQPAHPIAMRNHHALIISLQTYPCSCRSVVHPRIPAITCGDWGSHPISSRVNICESSTERHGSSHVADLCTISSLERPSSSTLPWIWAVHAKRETSVSNQGSIRNAYDYKLSPRLCRWCVLW
jgi:hypothetical protein